MLSSFGSARPSLAGRPNHYPPKNSILRETRLRSVIEVTIRWPDLQRKEIRIHYTGKDELTPFTCNVLAVNRICGRRRGLNHGRGRLPGRASGGCVPSRSKVQSNFATISFQKSEIALV